MKANELANDLDEPWVIPWNREDLESVDACPVCNSQQREKLHSGLVDKVFRVAAGQWTLYRCFSCASAYLDPRPTEDSIGQAYKSYYTHIPPARGEYPTLSSKKRLLRRLANGYCNHHYGKRNEPHSWLGNSVICLLPIQRNILDIRHRFLPKPKKGDKVLDVGFGNGAFLNDSKAVGWEVTGVDPDKTAVANVKKRGMDVCQGGIEVFEGRSEIFEAITISHVIEHVHDPEMVLKNAYRLLKPGGVLFIETPNIESYGYRLFRHNWLPLDSPRHLIIFSKNSIRDLLHKVGFNNIRFKSRPEVSTRSYIYSTRLESDLEPYEAGAPSARIQLRSKVFSLKSRINKSGMEFLTLLAIKGKTN